MKKIIITILLVFLTGCSATQNGVNDSVVMSSSNELSIDDIAWEVYYGLHEDSNRYMLLDFTNNSNFPILEFDIKFREKDGEHQNEKDKFYQYVEGYITSDQDREYLEELKQSNEYYLSCTYDEIIEPNEKITEELVFFYGYMFVPYEELYEICEPDYIEISYAADGKVYEAIYDYISNKISIEDTGDVIYEWEDTELSKLIIKPDSTFVSLVSSIDNYFVVEVENQKNDSFYKEYVEKIKEKGFNIDVEENGDDSYKYYNAKNSEGISISIDYDSDSKQMRIAVER